MSFTTTTVLRRFSTPIHFCIRPKDSQPDQPLVSNDIHGRRTSLPVPGHQDDVQGGLPTILSPPGSSSINTSDRVDLEHTTVHRDSLPIEAVGEDDAAAAAGSENTSDERADDVAMPLENTPSASGKQSLQAGASPSEKPAQEPESIDVSGPASTPALPEVSNTNENVGKDQTDNTAMEIDENDTEDNDDDEASTDNSPDLMIVEVRKLPKSATRPPHASKKGTMIIKEEPGLAPSNLPQSITGQETTSSSSSAGTKNTGPPRRKILKKGKTSNLSRSSCRIRDLTTGLSDMGPPPPPPPPAPPTSSSTASFDGSTSLSESSSMFGEEGTGDGYTANGTGSNSGAAFPQNRDGNMASGGTFNRNDDNHQQQQQQQQQQSAHDPYNPFTQVGDLPPLNPLDPLPYNTNTNTSTSTYIPSSSSPSSSILPTYQPPPAYQPKSTDQLIAEAHSTLEQRLTSRLTRGLAKSLATELIGMGADFCGNGGIGGGGGAGAGAGGLKRGRNAVLGVEEAERNLKAASAEYAKAKAAEERRANKRVKLRNAGGEKGGEKGDGSGYGYGYGGGYGGGGSGFGGGGGGGGGAGGARSEKSASFFSGAR